MKKKKFGRDAQRGSVTPRSPGQSSMQGKQGSGQKISRSRPGNLQAGYKAARKRMGYPN